MSGSASPNPAPIRLPALDYLRFIAALMVLAYHYLFRGSVGAEYLSMSFDPAGPWLIFAYFGVNLFFMISGFVILWSAEDKGWFAFGVARFVRLWPAYVLAVSLTAAAAVAYGDPLFETNLRQWLANLTFFAPAFGEPFMDGVYWTIVLEIIFYFWVALGLATGVLQRHLMTACLVWLYFIAANEFWLQSDALQKALLTRHGPWFLIGVLTYHIWARGWSLVPVILLFTASTLSFNTAMLEQAHIADEFSYPADLVGASVMNGAMIALFWVAIPLSRWIPSTHAALTIGALTYPLYLIHQHMGYMLIETLVERGLDKWAAVGTTAMAMLVLSWMIVVLWERPVSWVLKRIIRGVGNLFTSKQQPIAAE